MRCSACRAWSKAAPPYNMGWKYVPLGAGGLRIVCPYCANWLVKNGYKLTLELIWNLIPKEIQANHFASVNRDKMFLAELFYGG